MFGLVGSGWCAGLICGMCWCWVVVVVGCVWLGCGEFVTGFVLCGIVVV